MRTPNRCGGRPPVRCRSTTTGPAGRRSAERDTIIGALQVKYDWLRPVCFYSAYEAATSFVIGQRIAMRQARAIKARLTDALGDPIQIGGREVRAFPAAPAAGWT